MALLPTIPPEQMTPRARSYLLIVAAYCITMAIGLVALPEWFQTKNFRIVIDMLPCQQNGWAFVHVMVGFIAIFAAWRGSGAAAYRALMAAAVVVGVWAAGFIWTVIVAFQTDSQGSWSAAVAYTSIVAIHMVQARQPIRSPFDPLVRDFNDR